MADQTARERGYRAYARSGFNVRNPFHESQPEHDEWARGFAKALSDLAPRTPTKDTPQ